MSSLDVLDYQTGVEEALARRGPDGRPLLEAPLRRQALRDVRRLIDALAFRYAIIDDRPLPEDLDYIRALEGLKRPDAVAPVLARRRPHYQRVRRRRLTTSWTVLGVILLFIAGLLYVATLEKAEEVALVNERGDAGAVFEQTFTIGEEITRLHVDGTIVVAKDAGGPIVVSLIGPDNREYLGTEGRLGAEFTSRGGNYLRENVNSPIAGEWTLRVNYGGAGSAMVTVLAIQPAR